MEARAEDDDDEFGGTIDCLGGVFITSGDGSINLDYTFDSILEDVWSASMKQISDILFVSSNGWDAIGATWFGYTTLWVNRAGLPPEELGTQPTHTGRSLRDVLALFG